ncbi:MAG: hypothetical protein ACTTH5_08505 [Wolinella sp.]
MGALVETLRQVSLGLFVNGSYGIMQGGYNMANFIIVFSMVLSMYFLNKFKE